MKIMYDSEADKRHRMVVDGSGGKLNVLAFKLEMVFEDGSQVSINRPSGGYTQKSLRQVIVDWKKEFPNAEDPE